MIWNLVGLFFMLLAAQICHAVKRAELVQQIWEKVNGSSIQDLVADRRFPHHPTRVAYLSTFDAPQDKTENFGQRIRGYFVPIVSGEYKFYSSCDDMCEVFLGLNGKGGEDNRIVNQRRSSGHNEFEKFPEQSSKPIILQKQTPYYLEAVGIHRRNPNHLSLGVQFPNGTKEFPISENYFRRSFKATLGTQGARRTKGKHPAIFSDLKNKLETLGRLAHLYIKKEPSRKKFIGDGMNEGQEGAKIVESRIDNDDDSTRNRGKHGGQALLDVTGAEYSDSDAIEPGINVFPWETDKNKLNGASSGGLINNGQSVVRGPSFANVLGVARMVSNGETPPNETVLEMNQVGRNIGPLAMNLVNISNFKVVIPGGKSYQVLGTREGKPSVTVYPSGEQNMMNNPNGAPEKQLAVLDGTNSMETGNAKNEGPGLKATTPGGGSPFPSMNGGMQAGANVNQPQLPPTLSASSPKEPVTVEKLTTDAPNSQGSKGRPETSPGGGKAENSTEEPDIIKVEFVPEEEKEELAKNGNTVPSSKSSPGSVKVEFVPHRDKSKPLSVKNTNEPVASALPAIATAASNMLPLAKSASPAEAVYASISQSPVADLKPLTANPAPATPAEAPQTVASPQQRADSPATTVTSMQMPATPNGMQTVIGSVMNNASGQVTPFAVTVLTDPKQLDAMGKGKALNITTRNTGPQPENSQPDVKGFMPQQQPDFMFVPNPSGSPGASDAQQALMKPFGAQDSGMGRRTDTGYGQPGAGGMSVGAVPSHGSGGDNGGGNSYPGVNAATSAGIGGGGGGGGGGGMGMGAGGTQEYVEPEFKGGYNAASDSSVLPVNGPPPLNVAPNIGTAQNSPLFQKPMAQDNSIMPGNPMMGESMIRNPHVAAPPSLMDIQKSDGGGSLQRTPSSPQGVPEKLFVAPPNASPGSPSARAPAVSPVATELMNDVMNSVVSPEEALQMMNDYVSGNQDMSKSITNLQRMLGSVREKLPGSPGLPTAPSMPVMSGMSGGSAISGLPNMAMPGADPMTGVTPVQSNLAPMNMMYPNNGQGGPPQIPQGPLAHNGMPITQNHQSIDEQIYPAGPSFTYHDSQNRDEDGESRHSLHGGYHNDESYNRENENHDDYPPSRDNYHDYHEPLAHDYGMHDHYQSPHDNYGMHHDYDHDHDRDREEDDRQSSFHGGRNSYDEDHDIHSEDTMSTMASRMQDMDGSPSPIHVYGKHELLQRLHEQHMDDNIMSDELRRTADDLDRMRGNPRKTNARHSQPILSRANYLSRNFQTDVVPNPLIDVPTEPGPTSQDMTDILNRIDPHEMLTNPNTAGQNALVSNQHHPYNPVPKSTYKSRFQPPSHELSPDLPSMNSGLLQGPMGLPQESAPQEQPSSPKPHDLSNFGHREHVAAGMDQTLDHEPESPGDFATMNSGLLSGPISFNSIHSGEHLPDANLLMPVIHHTPTSYGTSQGYGRSHGHAFESDEVSAHHHSHHGGTQDMSPGISDLYTDSLFPEDLADLKSLKGSLQGQTMTEFDKMEQEVGTKEKTLRRLHAHQEKATYPIEGMTAGMGDLLDSANAVRKSTVNSKRAPRELSIAERRRKNRKRQVKREQKTPAVLPSKAAVKRKKTSKPRSISQQRRITQATTKSNVSKKKTDPNLSRQGNQRATKKSEKRIQKGSPLKIKS